MKLLVDECCDVGLIDGLRADDETVLRTAVAQERVLLTEDKDFGELVIRLELPAHGLILLRLGTTATPAKLHRLRAVLAADPDRFVGSFTVIESDKVRFRPLYRPPNAP